MSGIQVVDLPAQPADMGGQYLAEALEQGATGYAAEQRRLQDRRQQLSDVSAENAEKDKRTAAEHSFQEADFDHRQKATADADALRQSGQLNQVFLEALVSHGYLTPQDIKDPAKVQAASTRAMNDGLIERFSDLINHGYLAVDQINDPNAVLAAQKKSAAATTAGYTASADAKKNAVVSATAVFRHQQQVAGEIDKVTAAASLDPEAEAQKALSPQIIDNAAAKLARDANPGKTLTPQMIAAQRPAAEQAIKQQLFIQAQQRQAQAKAILPSLQRTYASDGNRLSQFDKQGITPDATDEGSPDVPLGADPAAQAPTPPPPNAQKAVFANLAGVGSPAPVSGGGPSPAGAPPAAGILSDAGADPQGAAIIQQQQQQQKVNARNLAIQQLEQPLQQATSQLADIQDQITKVKGNPNFGGIGSNSYPFTGGVSGGPDQQAAALTDLYAKQTALQAKVKQLQAQKMSLSSPETLGGPATGSTAALPAMSDTSGSAPANWMAPGAGMGGPPASY